MKRVEWGARCAIEREEASPRSLVGAPEPVRSMRAIVMLIPELFVQWLGYTAEHATLAAAHAAGEAQRIRSEKEKAFEEEKAFELGRG